MTSKSPRISVVIPVFNGERFLAEAIRSALAQTLPPYEILVVDDGSTDESAELAESFGPPVRVLREENRGEAAARNCGIEAARGDWIAFLDCDDVWKPEKLALQAAFFANGTDCIHTNFFYFGAIEGTVDVAQVPAATRYSLGYVAKRNPFRISSIVVRRDLDLRFPEWTQDGEDLIYFLELCASCRIHLVADFVTGYRVHSKGQSARTDMLVRRFQALQRYVESSPHLSPADKEAVVQGFLALMGEQAVLAKYRRNWPEYWAIRHCLAQWQGPLPEEAAPIVHEFIFPPFVYRIKDWLDRYLRADAGA
ncbi:MAG: glycosyltransferase family 2 protein [Thermogutta sp.]